MELLVWDPRYRTDVGAAVDGFGGGVDHILVGGGDGVRPAWKNFVQTIATIFCENFEFRDKE